MKKYIMFDLDGTLTDPKIGITTCVQYALHAAGIEEPDLDKLEPFIGPPLKDSFMEFYSMTEEQADAAVEKYRERFKDTGIFENKVYDGVPAMLKELHNKGIKLAVASSKPQVFVQRILEHFHIDQYFDVVVGSELDGTRVNKDEVVLEALNQLFHYKPIQRNQVYMVGDRKFDVEGAKEHGIESVAVAYGYGSMEELKEAKADYIVRSVEELQEFLLRGTDELEQLGTSTLGKNKKAQKDRTQTESSETGNGAETAKRTPNMGDKTVDNGTVPKKGTPTQRVWAVAFPLLMFMVVRAVALNAEVIFMQSVAETATGAMKNQFIWDETGELIGFSGSLSAIMTAIAYLAGGAAVFVRGKQMIKKTAEDMKLAHLRKESASTYVLLGLATVGAVLGLNLLMNLIGMLANSDAYQQVAASQYSAGIAVGLICYGLISPLVEEMLFRGIVYGYLRRFTGIKMAIPISAFLFGAYHMNGIQGIYGFLMGCLIAFGYEYFGDYKVAVGIHMTANVLAYLITYADIFTVQAVAWPVCIVSLICMVIGLVGLQKRKNIF